MLSKNDHRVHIEFVLYIIIICKHFMCTSEMFTHNMNKYSMNADTMYWQGKDPIHVSHNYLIHIHQISVMSSI